MSDQLSAAIAEIRSGNADAGRALLMQLLRQDPRNELAWLWLAGVVASADQRRDCLTRVLKLNPDNVMAQRGLAALDGPPKVVSADAAEAKNVSADGADAADAKNVSADGADGADTATSYPIPPTSYPIPLTITPTTHEPNAPEAQRAAWAAVQERAIMVAGLSSLIWPTLGIGFVVWFGRLSMLAAAELANGRVPTITGRRQGLKTIYIGLLDLLGPNGVLAVTVLVVLALLGLILFRCWRAYQLLQSVALAPADAAPLRSSTPSPAVVPTPAVPTPSGAVGLVAISTGAPSRAVIPVSVALPVQPARPPRFTRMQQLRILLGVLIALALAGTAWVWATSPARYPGLIEGGMVLDQSNMQLSNIDLRWVPDDKLVLIDLSNNPITELPASIGRFDRVEMLFIKNTGITTLPPEIGQLRNLRWLVLEGNQLTSLPPEIGQLQKLEVLSLNGNRLTSLPPEVGQLRNLRQLNLQFNPIKPDAIPAAVRENRTDVLLFYQP